MTKNSNFNPAEITPEYKDTSPVQFLIALIHLPANMIFDLTNTLLKCKILALCHYPTCLKSLLMLIINEFSYN
jgi:hypothetical protein